MVGDEAQLNQLMHLGQHVYGSTWGNGSSHRVRSRLTQLPRLRPKVRAGRRARAASRACGLRPASVRAGALAPSTASASARWRPRRERDTARASRCCRTRRPRAAPACRDRPDEPRARGHRQHLAWRSKTTRPESAPDDPRAQTARHHWAIAGTWLETERAEYRLANTWLQAGDLARAREHAQACLEIVAANGGVALERLFGWEALGLVERAAGNATGHAQALARAREAFAELDESDKSWCAASVDKLAA